MDKNDRIAVVMGGPSKEREVSLNTGNAILNALKEKGYDAVAIDLDPEHIMEQLKASGASVVFNAVHGLYGEDGRLQSVLEMLHIPYTGSGVLASALAMDKFYTKHLFQNNHVPTAKCTFIDRTLDRDPKGKILKEINDNNETRALTNIEVSAYASPDGKYSFNEKLAEKRQNVSTNYLKKELKKIKMEADVDTKFTAEDWEGFQELVSKSNLQDKEVILRVLSMYQDPEEREQQISNMSEVYTDIKHSILPELRRARLIVNYEIIGRSDAQILDQFAADPSKLSVEEMVYGANKLVKDDATRQKWNEAIAKQYPSDYRALNNMAQQAISKGDMAAAQNYLKQAANVNKNASEVNTNLALMALKSGDVAKAETYLSKGTGSDTFKEVMGNLNIAKGNYTQAASDLAGVNTNSAALAQILAKDYTSAKTTLSKIKNADATTSYLQAVLAARTGDANALSSSLKNAIQQDGTLAARAAKDLEFAKYANVVKNLVK